MTTPSLTTTNSTGSSPLVTVAVRAYNSRHFIEAALDGALSQTYRPLEIVICDDGSVDNTEDVILRWRTRVITDIPIYLIRHHRNMGVGAAINTIAVNSRGEYLLLADGDDISLPERAAECVAAIREHGPRCLAAVCQGQCIDAGGRLVPGRVVSQTERTFTAQSIASGAGVTGAVAVFSRRLFEAGPALDGLRNQEDRLLAYRAACLGDLVSVPAVLVLRRIHAGQTSGHLHRSSSPAAARVRRLQNTANRIRTAARMLQETAYFEREGYLGHDVADQLSLSLQLELRTLRLYRAAAHRTRQIRLAAVLTLVRRGVPLRTVAQFYVLANLPAIAAKLLQRHRYYRCLKDAHQLHRF